MAEKTKYSSEELKEFEQIILEKLKNTKAQYKILRKSLARNSGETSGHHAIIALEDGAESLQKEKINLLARRQEKFIINLENALVRIKNGTYGICVTTGKLISKGRLMSVPHTTHSIEAKKDNL